MRNRGVCLILIFVLTVTTVLPVQATSISDAKNAKSRTENELNEVNDQIDSLQSQKSTLAGEVEQMDSQLVDILTSISICQEEIAAKEEEIEQAKKELSDAIQKEAEQDEAMKKHIQLMYKKGDNAYLEILLESKSLADLATKAHYVEKVYDYDKELLEDYKETKENIKELKENLEEDEANLLASNYELEQEQKALEATIEEKKNRIKNFDAELANAKKQAAACKTKLKEQTEKLKRLEEEKKKEEEAIKKALEEKANPKKITVTADAGAQTTTDTTQTTPAANADTGEKTETAAANTETAVTSDPGDSAVGQQIASYACQFVGNPYVMGGTSLTNGADCSGFVQSVYKHFGYSLPRDSTSQRSAGRAVDYANAQPGDIICYAGHVAIYLGGGRIVHASSERTGIKYGTATYRTILCVRRIV